MPRNEKRSARLGELRVSRTVTKIGEAAGVIVNHAPKKFASAHDLRRSFGPRWASKVMPQVLMILMRHENIETTMRFYVGRDAEATADVLWATESNNSGNNGQTGHKKANPANAESVDTDRV